MRTQNADSFSWISYRFPVAEFSARGVTTSPPEYMPSLPGTVSSSPEQAILLPSSILMMQRRRSRFNIAIVLDDKRVSFPLEEPAGPDAAKGKLTPFLGSVRLTAPYWPSQTTNLSSAP